MEQARLSPCRQFHLQSVVVLPRNTHVSGLPHDTHRPVTLTLLTSCLVLRWIPGVRYPKGLDGSGNTVVVTLARSHHTELPVFADDGHPHPCEVDRGSRSRGLRRLGASLTPLSKDAQWCCKQKRRDNGKQGHTAPPHNSVIHSASK